MDLCFNFRICRRLNLVPLNLNFLNLTELRKILRRCKSLKTVKVGVSKIISARHDLRRTIRSKYLIQIKQNQFSLEVV